MVEGAPSVSVVVPTFNRPGYLCETLDSILAQTFTDYEVIIGNDGDARLLDDLRERYCDPRFVWIDHSPRLGMLRNNLACFARARGRFIANLHDDDRWAPDLLARLVPHLQGDPEIAVAFADHFVIDAAGNVDHAATEAFSRHWRRERIKPGRNQPFQEIAIINRSIPIQCAAVFRKDTLELDDFPDEVGPCYDFWISYQLARDGAAAYYESARLGYYRVHAASQTSSAAGAAEGGIYCFEQVLRDARLAKLPRRPLKRLLAGYHYLLGLKLLRNGQRGPALQHLTRALALDFRPRTVLAMGACALPSAALQR